MKLANLLVRPSDVVRDIENGFIGAAQLIGKVSIAAGQNAQEFSAGFKRGYKNEMRARKIADAAIVSIEISRMHTAEEMRDIESIRERTEQLIAARMSRKAG